jgi:superfamily II DNA or RNA helicase
MYALRDYQSYCLDKSLERLQAGVNRQLAVLATGLGKTAIAAALRSHHGFDKKVLFLIHMETLAAQAAEKIAAWNPGLMVGVEMANRYAAPMDTFVVASVPTIGRKGSARIDSLDPGDFAAVIQDEAHIGMADSFKRVYKHFGLLEPNPQGPLFFGITATPNRVDGQGLRALFDEIIYDMGIQKGIASGWLCDLRALRVKTKSNLDGVHTRAGDFAQDELSGEVNNPARNGLIVKEWYKNAFGRRTLAFTVDVKHALDLAEAFKQHAVNAEAVWGDDPDRHAKIQKFRDGQIDVLTNCAVLGIGFDCPEIGCIISAAPTKSFVRYAQQIGRGTRISDGKEDCLIIDVCDNATKHNLCTVSTLLGLPKDLDLKGERFTAAKQKIERIAAEFPTANVWDITKLSELDTLAEHIELFTVKYPPEIGQLTELAWRKQGDGYILPVMREHLALSCDLRDEWWVRGVLNGKQVEIHSQNLAGAFNCADREILANNELRRLLARDAHWRDHGPSEKQVALCRKLHLAIPAGATRGQVSAAIDKCFAGKGRRR